MKETDHPSLGPLNAAGTMGRDEIENHRHYMDLALGEARQAFSEGEVPIGCLIVDGTTILAATRNSRERDRSPLAHAEMRALQLAAQKKQNWRLTGCTLYVTAEPCPMCMGAILHSRIGEVVFAVREPQTGSIASRIRLAEHFPYFSPPRVVEGVRAEASRELLRKFFESRREEGPSSGRYS